MEYQYANDPITGIATACFSLEHEIIGPWLEVEIGNNSDRLTCVLVALDVVESGKQEEVTITGHEYTAIINRDEVTISVNVSLNGSESPIPLELMDDFDNVDAGFTASCGSDDFRHMLLAWAQFVGH